MTVDAVKQALFGPTAVAVHYDGNVGGQIGGVQVNWAGRSGARIQGFLSLFLDSIRR